MNTSASIILKVMNLPGVGRKTAFKLFHGLKHSIRDNYDLMDFVNENPTIIRKSPSKWEFQTAFDNAEITLEKSDRAGIKVIGYNEKDYPILLLNVEDPPLLLSAKGDYRRLNELPSVAIIGTRAPSEYGYKVGHRLGQVFGESGFNVVSGLAIGCDTAGHTGCLDKGGFTTAVLAHGLDTIYPAANKPLAARILDNCGLLISEYLIGQKSQPSYFVERDRIQAGLSQSVIVVETDIKGGTMHTVKFAKAAKRIVAAFNHDARYLNHPKTQGNQYLIKNGTAQPLSDTISIENLKNTLLDLAGFVFKPSLEIKPTPKKEEPKIEFAGTVYTVKSEPAKIKKTPKAKTEKVAASGKSKKPFIIKSEAEDIFIKVEGKTEDKAATQSKKGKKKPEGKVNGVQLDVFTNSH
ncbi:DNA-processing protein DprA [Larkinella sp. GY13]|uniref:DNA-processing protein DprA n=1 Tax=Larkinella sp. GY13 TaxID=3453720 RepID=UPI003EE9D86B